MNRMAAREIFTLILTSPRISPREIAARLNYSPQYVKNHLLSLSQLSLVEAPYHGSYRITAKGERYFDILQEEDQTSEASKT